MRAEKNKDVSRESTGSGVCLSQPPYFSSLYKGLFNLFKLPYRCFAVSMKQRSPWPGDSDWKHAPYEQQHQTV